MLEQVTFKTACRVCRDRKVKCDKRLPCRNCTLADIVCSYPPQVRTVRRPKRAGQKAAGHADQSVADRLNRLEELLRKHAPDLGNHLLSNDLASVNTDQGQVPNRQPDADTANALDALASLDLPGPLRTSVEDARSEWSPSSEAVSPLVEPALDKGADADGHDYWKRLEQECADHVFFHATPAPERSAKEQQASTEHAPHSAATPPSGTGFPFLHQTGSLPPPLLSLAQRRVCWARYVDNVDPMLKILHKPTVEGLITVRDVYHYKLHPHTGALVQAVCLLAVVSMPEQDVAENLGGERSQLVRVCGSRLEQTLVLANFLDARDLTTMQALLLYLYYLKHKEDPKLYGLRGMTIFLAARLGLNRDRVATGTSRLEVELRRRLWWQLITLVDHPDDCATDYAPPSVGADTRLPLNINDDELEQPPACADGHGGRRGFTESSFCLMQYEITRLFNRIRFERAHTPERPTGLLASAEERLNSSRQRMESQYFHNTAEMAATRSSPLSKFAADAVAMILAKRRLLMYISPDIRAANAAPSPLDADHLFLLAIHVLELSRRLQTSRHFEKWRWLSGTYFQWHVAGFVVRDLCKRPTSAATRRAWNVVNGILDSWPESTRTSPKAASLRELIVDAVRARDQQIVWSLSSASPLADRTCRVIPPAGTMWPAATDTLLPSDGKERQNNVALGWTAGQPQPQLNSPRSLNQTLSQTLGQEEFFLPEITMYDSNLVLDYDMP